MLAVCDLSVSCLKVATVRVKRGRDAGLMRRVRWVCCVSSGGGDDANFNEPEDGGEIRRVDMRFPSGGPERMRGDDASDAAAERVGAPGAVGRTQADWRSDPEASGQRRSTPSGTRLDGGEEAAVGDRRSGRGAPARAQKGSRRAEGEGPSARVGAADSRKQRPDELAAFDARGPGVCLRCVISRCLV